MKMKIFGGFLLYDENTAIDEKTLHSNKLVRLLVYLILHRDRNLTHQELIDTFWQEDKSRNPEGALKNLVYRLRMELKVFGEQELILTYPGIYRWNPEIVVETDYEELERAAKQVQTQTNLEKRRLLCGRVLELYNRQLSARIGSENWMLAKAAYYKLLYMDAAKNLAEIYGEEQSYDSLESLCLKALETDQMDEDMYYWLVKSQIGKKNYEKAIEYYEEARQLFYEEFGLREVERLEEVYEEILAISDNQRADLGSLILSVSEKQSPDGVFFCEYPVFREIYRVESRRIHRTGIAEYVLLISMKRTGKNKTGSSDEGMKTGMQMLGELLKDVLRTGDVAARYSSTQYVLLLATCTYESTVKISERIKERFQKIAGKRRLYLQFEIEEMTAETIK